LDNKASEKKYSSIGQIIFGKDGKLIYKVIGEDGEFLVIDGQEGQLYTSIGEIVILDDGRIAFQAELNGEQVTIIDGQVVDNSNQDPTDGSDSTGTTDSSSSDSSNGGSSSGSSSSSSSKKIIQPGRPKKDWNITPEEKSIPPCTGDNCNF